MAARLLFPEQWEHVQQWFPSVADALAVGCLLALMRDEIEARPAYMRWLRSRWGLWVPAITMMTIQVVRRPDAVLALFYSAATALLLHRLVTVPTGLAGRLLNARPMVWMGNMSYSLYLWQQPFVSPGAAYSVFPLNAALAFIASASFYLIEKPLIRIGRNLSSDIKARQAVAAAGVR